MALDNINELEQWFKCLIDAGGAIYSVDFHDYFKKEYCNNYGIPNSLIYNIKFLRQVSYEDLCLFETCHTDEFIKLRSKQLNGNLDYSAHILWVLAQPLIKFVPIIVWDSNSKKLIIQKGQSRILNKFINSEEAKCIYVKYPGDPEIDIPNNFLHSIDDLYNSTVYSGFENIDRYITIEHNPVDLIGYYGSRHGALNYGNYDLEAHSISVWRTNILKYWRFALKIDLSSVTLDDFKFNNINKSMSGGILKLRGS